MLTLEAEHPVTKATIPVIVSTSREFEGHTDSLLGEITVKTLNIGTPRPATVVVLNIKPFNFTMK